MWRETAGHKLVDFAGASGTVALPKGAIVVLIIAHASGAPGTLRLPSGQTVPVINGANALYIQNYHALMQQNASTVDLVFTGTDQYYVQVLVPGNT